MDLGPRFGRFIACIKGGLLAAIFAAPVVGVGSALQGGPVISVSDILLPTFVAVMATSVLIIGAFRLWDVRFFSGYAEGVILFLIIRQIFEMIRLFETSKGGSPLVESVIIVMNAMLRWTDGANEYLFGNCANIDTSLCILRVAIGSIFYSVIVGTLLAAPVGFDAFFAYPRLAYFTDRQASVSMPVVT